MIATKKTSEYDHAVTLLRDLRALAERQGEVETAAFNKRMLDLRAQYPTRPGLQEPPRRSGLPSLTSVKLSWVTLEVISTSGPLALVACHRPHSSLAGRDHEPAGDLRPCRIRSQVSVPVS